MVVIEMRMKYYWMYIYTKLWRNKSYWLQILISVEKFFIVREKSHENPKMTEPFKNAWGTAVTVIKRDGITSGKGNDTICEAVGIEQLHGYSIGQNPFCKKFCIYSGILSRDIFL